MGKTFRPYPSGRGVLLMKLAVFTGVFLSSLGLAIGYFLFSASVPSPDVSVFHLQEPCNLRVSPCVARDSIGRSIQFQLSPKTLPLMQALTAEVSLQGIEDVQSARVVVEGVNMFMGFQHTELLPQGQTLTGQLVLPVCSMERMEWAATVELVSARETFRAVFPFVTQR